MYILHMTARFRKDHDFRGRSISWVVSNEVGFVLEVLAMHLHIIRFQQGVVALTLELDET